jgi:hypothetical protein
VLQIFSDDPYASPHGTTVVTGNLTAADNPITFTNSVAVDDAVTVDAGADSILFGGSGTQMLQSGSGARWGNVEHNGPGTLQLTSPLTITGTFTNSAGTFDAHDQSVTVSRSATISGGTYLAGTTPQNFLGGLILSGGAFTSSSGPMTINGPVAVIGGSFSGEGTVGPLTALSGSVTPGTIDPGTLYVSGAVSMFSATTFNVRLNGLAPGREYSQLISNGRIYLGSSTLSLVLGFEPPVGSAFALLTTADSGGIFGTFAGLPEGAMFSQGGNQFQITYQGGDSGTSVVLTRLA